MSTSGNTGNTGNTGSSEKSGNWIDVAAPDDVWEDAGTSVIAAGRDIALFRIGDELFAIDNLCTHGHARLCEGFIEGHEIECPLHQGRFDLRSGAATCEPATEAVRSYGVRLSEGRVWVLVDGE